MKTTLLTFSLLFSFSNAFADQAATLTCTGENIILTVKSPYLGEDSEVSQKLYVLKSKTANDSETAYTAFFLDAEEDRGPQGTVYISAKNSQGGSFDLLTNSPKDDSDGTVIRETSEGTLTYNHGPLKGQERVSCVTE